mmetsp:Transcript_53891/g.125734  ORF Transcript_53891/g.125734 Transcript_53891/m.125734 type:complete len:379 (+) Transcript_53891:68-1204(+)
MAQPADPVFEALGLCSNPSQEPPQEVRMPGMPEQPYLQADYMDPMQLQQQMQMQFQSQIQQQVMYQVQQHVQQHIQQQMQQSAAGEPGTATQDAAFKSPEAICAFAAAATAAALVYFQASGVAPQQQLMLPEVLPAAAPAPGMATPSSYCYEMPPLAPSAWPAAWYAPGAPATQAQTPPNQALTEEVPPCTPVKTQADPEGAEGIITPSPVPLDMANLLDNSPPVVLKLSEVVTVSGERSPTTTASEQHSMEASEENAGAMLLQLLKGGASPEEDAGESWRAEEHWRAEESWENEVWPEEDWSSRETRQRRRRRRRGGVEGHQTPSTVASDGERQALAASGQELLRQLRAGPAKEEETAKPTHTRRAKNGEVRVFRSI